MTQGIAGETQWLVRQSHWGHSGCFPSLSLAFPSLYWTQDGRATISHPRPIQTYTPCAPRRRTELHPLQHPPKPSSLPTPSRHMFPETEFCCSSQRGLPFPAILGQIQPQTRHSYPPWSSLSDGQRPGEGQAWSPSYTGPSEIRDWAAETDLDGPTDATSRQPSSQRLRAACPEAPPTAPPTAGRFTPASGATSWEPAGTFLLLGLELVASNFISAGLAWV